MMKAFQAMMLLGAIACLVSGRGHSTTSAAENVEDPDEQFLKDSNVATNRVGLLKYLAERSGHDDDLLRLEELIKQLGSTDFKARRQAMEKLVAIGPPAHARLLEAQKDKDKERARGAKEAADQINHAWNFGLNLTVVRYLIKHANDKPPLSPGGRGAGDEGGTAKALLQFLPYAADPDCEEEIWFGIDGIAKTHPQVVAVLADSLKDKISIRRAVAGYLLTRRGNAAPGADATRLAALGKKLLTDSDPLVQLRTAQGLLGSKDKDAIPVLIDLLEKLTWTEEAWQAEEMLHYVAGDDSPEVTIDAGSAEMRQKCRNAWHDWWESSRGKIDLLKIDGEYRRPVLIVLHTSATFPKDPHFVCLIGCDGQTRWRQELFLNYVQLLPRDRILVGECEERDIPRSKAAKWIQPSGMAERDLNGKVVWQAPKKYAPQVAYRLPNHDTFFLHRYQIGEISADGRERYFQSRPFLITEGKFKDFQLECLQRLGNAQVLCAWDPGLGPEWLAQCDPKTGTIKLRTVLVDKVTFPCRIESLSNANYLIAGPNISPQIREVDSHGKTIWRFTMSDAVQATRLANGTTLVFCGRPEKRIIEVDSDGKIVWETLINEATSNLSVVLKLTRLGFDSPRPANANLATSVPYRIKGLANKNPAIRLASARVLQGLGSKAESAVPDLIRALNDPDPTVREAASDALRQVGRNAVPALLVASSDRAVNIRVGAIGVLGDFKADGALVIPILADALGDEASEVRQKSGGSLAKLGPSVPGVVATFMKALDSKFPDVRGNAASCLGGMGRASKPAVPLLWKALEKDPSFQVRYYAADSIGTICKGDAEAVRKLIELLKSKDPEDHFLGTLALGHLGAESKAALPDLKRVYQVNPNVEQNLREKIRVGVIWAFGEIGPEASDTVPLILEAFQNRKNSETLRIIALDSLGKMGSKASSALPILEKFQEKEDPALRTIIQATLEKIK
jgi:HEAT repeat protein